jgi:hypothetical protein
LRPVKHLLIVLGKQLLIPVKPTIKSDRNQPPSPVETFHVFRFKLTTDSVKSTTQSERSDAGFLG